MKKIFKRSFAAVTAVVIAFTAVFVFDVPKATVASAATVSDFAALKNAIASGGTITITSDITFTECITVNKTVTIQSQGDHTLKRGSYTGEMFNVITGGNLTLDGSGNNLTVDGGITWSGPIDPILGRGKTKSGPSASDPMIDIKGSGIVTLKTGVTLQNAYSSVSTGSVVGMYDSNACGTLNINGAVIRNNYASNGGAIKTHYNGTVNMTAGEIYGNESGRHGGAMQIYGKTPNESTGGQAHFNMSGGKIHNNLSAGVGGAIAVSDYGHLTLSGNAEIYGNETTDSSKRGGGVGFIDSNTTLNISGNAKIYDNIDSSGKANNLAIGTKNNIIKLGTLSSGAKIGVTYNPGSVNTSSSFAETNSTDYSGCFFSDRDGYFVQYKSQGLYLTKACTTHSWNSGTVTTPATCTANGEKTYTCTVCGATKTEDIAATGHSWGTAWSTDNSQHWHKCSVCGEKKDEAEHSWDICFPYSPSPGTYHVFKCSVCGSQRSGYFKHSGGTATCTSKAVCEYCGREYGSLAAHTTTHTASKAATCTVDGNKEYWYCSKCQKYFGDSTCKTEITKASIVIAKTGHSTTHTAAKAATCTEDGNKEYWYCSTCKKYFSDSACTTEITDTLIKRTGHNWSTDWSTSAEQHWKKCTNPGCSYSKDSVLHTFVQKSDGENHWQECSVCGYKKDEVNHTWNNGVVTTEPTCTTQGVKTYTCTECGKTKTENIATIAHNYDMTTWANDGTNHWHKCTGCGDKKDTAAHSYGGWTLTSNPTLTATGTAKHTCSICGYEQTESVPTLTDTNVWTKDNNKHIDPTEEAEGKDVYTSEYGEVTVVIPELEHVHNNLTHVDEVPATETTEGVKEHWHCRCGKDFLDEDGTQEATADDLRIGKIQKEVQASENVPKPEIATSGEDLINATLTEEDKNEVQQGKDIKIILKVEDATENAPDDDKTAVTEELNQRSRYKLGQYLDVTLLKQIGEEQQKITTTSALIKITFEIPSAFRGKPKYSVIRVHDGVATVLDDLDSDPNTVTIETDKFSTYALTYKEKTSSGSSGGSGSGSSGGSSGGGYRPHRPSTSVPSDDTSNDTSDDTSSNTSDDASSDTSDDTSSNTSDDVSSDTSDDTSSDTSGDASSDTSDDTPSDTSDETPDDSSNGTSDGNENSDIQNGVNPSDNNENPSTGIAVSIIPIVAILSGVIVVINRKKK